MADFEVSVATAQEVRRLRDWADDEGWNPGVSDGQAFFPTDPQGFLVGRLNGEAVAAISAIRYGADFGFIGFYLARPAIRGQGYGFQVWQAGMARLEGRNVGLDGVVEQQGNYRKSGFRPAWNNIRYEGVPSGHAAKPDEGVTLVDARTVPFDQLAAYDRRFFPAARDAFLSSWLTIPDHTALVALAAGEIRGLGVLRPCSGASRVGPLYAASDTVARSLLTALSATTPGLPIAIDVPDINKPSVATVEQLGLTPSFETARMYTGPTPDIDLPGLFAVTTLELG
jgi:hypothetical protein